VEEMSSGLILLSVIQLLKILSGLPTPDNSLYFLCVSWWRAGIQEAETR
jgi:hypothetical protein